MEAATPEKLQKINTMKLMVTFFTTKLQNFVDETSVTDKDLLILLGNLTDCIEDFVSESEVIETNHRIDSITNNFRFDNIFECLACNILMGKTYTSVANHINTVLHRTNVMQSKQASTLSNTISSLASPMPNFTANNVFEMKSHMTLPMGRPLTSPLPHNPTLNSAMSTANPSTSMSTVPVTMPNFPTNNGRPLLPPLPYNPIPLLPVELSNYLQKYHPFVPPPLLSFGGPMLNAAQRGDFGNNHNGFFGFGSSNSNVSREPPMNPIHGSHSNAPVSTSNYCQPPPRNDCNQNKGILKTPSSTGSGNPQSNVIPVSNFSPGSTAASNPRTNPVSNSSLNSTPTTKMSVPPVAEKTRKNRKKKTDSEPVQFEVKFLNAISQAFLRDDFERAVKHYVHDAKLLTDERLYDDVARNLIACCKQMNLNAEIKCFGSRINGVGMHQSDIHTITVAHCKPVPDRLLTSDTFLKRLEKVLGSNAAWTNALYIRSRVSLVRARFQNRLDCDITFNNDHAMTNTKLIKYFYRIQPECHKLAVFLRLLTKKTKLYPLINMYTLNLLVFFYFQDVGYLPKVVDLIEKSPMNYFPMKFTEKSLEELNMKVTDEKFIDLCIGFMDFYANHVDFGGNVIKLRQQKHVVLHSI